MEEEQEQGSEVANTCTLEILVDSFPSNTIIIAYMETFEYTRYQQLCLSFATGPLTEAGLNEWRET